MKIRIITDSASDMPAVHRPEVAVLSMTVTFGAEEFQDGINLTHHQFYEKLIEGEDLPTTSQISPSQFEEVFQAAVDAGETVVAVVLSAKLSGTYQSACIAAEEFPGQVFVVDSANATLGELVLVERAVELMDQGLDAAAIAARLEEEKKEVRLVGLLDTLDAAGNYFPDAAVEMHAGITDNAPCVDFATSLLNTPTVGQASQNPPENDGPSAEADPSVHVNHFVSATPRYDDTKFVETERNRAGFIRTPENPVLALEIIQGYFSGSGSTGFKWVTGASTIDKGSSRMMRYKIVLSNLSDQQMAALNYVGEQDYCANPQISQILPYVEGFGAAQDMNDKKLKYVAYDDLFTTKESPDPNNPGQNITETVYKKEYEHFNWDYVSTRKGNKPHSNIDNSQVLWTYYVADMTDFLEVEDVVRSNASSMPRMNTPGPLNGDGPAFKVADKAASVDAGILGYHMYRGGQEFKSGDGIVTKGGDNTIANIGVLAREGMQQTDKTILEIMTQRGDC